MVIIAIKRPNAVMVDIILDSYLTSTVKCVRTGCYYIDLFTVFTPK